MSDPFDAAIAEIKAFREEEERRYLEEQKIVSRDLKASEVVKWDSKRQAWSIFDASKYYDKPIATAHHMICGDAGLVQWLREEEVHD
jgi:hypothetical protein